jgi:hypothetical protein
VQRCELLGFFLQKAKLSTKLSTVFVKILGWWIIAMVHEQVLQACAFAPPTSFGRPLFVVHHSSRWLAHLALASLLRIGLGHYH